MKCSPIMSSLEPRRLLAYSLTDGVLSVVGGKRADGINVKMTDSTHFQLNTDFHQVTFSLDDVTRIEIDGRASGDLITNFDVPVPMFVTGGPGPDTITGGPAADRLYGVGGQDNLRGGDGNDTLIGGVSVDLLEGNAGDDTLLPLASDFGDRVLGGRGYDTVDYSADTADVQISTFRMPRDSGERDFLAGTDTIIADVERVLLGSGDDAFDNRTRKGMYVSGGAGDDTIGGSDGPDHLVGGPGADKLYGNGGSDIFNIGGQDGAADFVDGGTKGESGSFGDGVIAGLYDEDDEIIDASDGLTIN